MLYEVITPRRGLQPLGRDHGPLRAHQERVPHHQHRGLPLRPLRQVATPRHPGLGRGPRRHHALHRPADQIDHPHLRRHHRITSYNVCYTKLLRFTGGRLKSMVDEDGQGVVGRLVGVDVENPFLLRGDEIVVPDVVLVGGGDGLQYPIEIIVLHRRNNFV